MSTAAPPAPPPATDRRRRPHPVRTVALPLALLTVVFLAFALRPYLTLDPAQARLPLPQDVPWFYPALVLHIGFGAVALVTAVLQVWPWLRRHHPAVHRWSGRVYLFGGVFPGSVAAFGVAPFALSGGVTANVANTMLALLWLLTGIAGYRAARQRRFAEHREWMLRSVALTFSIVLNRFWSTLCVVLFVPGAITGAPMDEAALAQAVGVSTWLSWVVNLLVVEWWLHRTRNRGRSVPVGTAGSRPEGSRSVPAP